MSELRRIEAIEGLVRSEPLNRNFSYVESKAHEAKVKVDEKIDEFDKVKLDLEGYYDEVEVNEYRDEESKTTYYLIKIPRKDKDGNDIKIRHNHTGNTYINGNDVLKTVREFSYDQKATVAINASPFSSSTKRIAGIYLKDGEIIQELNAREFDYTLAIDDNNNMKTYPPNTPAQEIISDGYSNAISTFIPLIENGRSVSDSIINLRDIFNEPHPRSAIAQDNYGNTYFFVSEGRVIGEYGMFAKDVIRVLLSHNMIFAQMLDGGGSAHATNYHMNINRVSGDMGAVEREVGNALYIAKDKGKVNETSAKLLKIIGDSEMRVQSHYSELNRLRYQPNNYIELEQYLINGWENYGSSGSNKCRGWVMPNNTLYLVGTITGGELSKPFMRLPIDEIKPTFTTHHLVCGNKENEIYKIIVGSDGELQWYYWNTAGRPPNTDGPNFIKLDGIFVPLNTPNQGIQR